MIYRSVQLIDGVRIGRANESVQKEICPIPRNTTAWTALGLNWLFAVRSHHGKAEEIRCSGGIYGCVIKSVGGSDDCKGDIY
jgi:hypothetical protein